MLFRKSGSCKTLLASDAISVSAEIGFDTSKKGLGCPNSLNKITKQDCHFHFIWTGSGENLRQKNLPGKSKLIDCKISAVAAALPMPLCLLKIINTPIKDELKINQDLMSNYI